MRQQLIEHNEMLRTHNQLLRTILAQPPPAAHGAPAMPNT